MKTHDWTIFCQKIVWLHDFFVCSRINHKKFMLFIWKEMMAQWKVWILNLLLCSKINAFTFSLFNISQSTVTSIKRIWRSQSTHSICAQGQRLWHQWPSTYPFSLKYLTWPIRHLWSWKWTLLKCSSKELGHNRSQLEKRRVKAEEDQIKEAF